MFLLREAGLPGRLLAAKTMDALRPIGTAQSPQGEREAFVRAKRAKRSGAAAKRLDGDGPMWPPVEDV